MFQRSGWNIKERLSSR